MDVRVTLSADPKRTVTIPITIDQATSAAAEDYSLSSTSVTFASGEISKDITLTATDDDVDDDGEVVVLAFGTLPQRVSRGVQTSTTVTIADDDDPNVSVQFASSVYSVPEDEAVDVRVTLSADPERTVTIPITIDQATSAAAEDYSLSSTSVTFASGEISKDITLTATDDDVDDDGEVVVLAFGTLPQRVSRGVQTSTTVTIADDDDPNVSVQFASSVYSVPEDEAVDVRVTLSADPERTVTIPLAIDQATSAAAEDYSLSSTSVTFASGETSKDITLTATDDVVDDDNEVVVLAFGTLPQRVSRGVQTSTMVTIADDDDPNVSVQFASSVYSVPEDEAVDVRVTLSADPERTVTIPITIDQATSAAAEDYSLSSTSVTFASGEISKDITLTATDDDVDDDNEVVVLAFGTLPQRVSRGVQTSTMVTIRDVNSPRLRAEAGENRTVAQREEVILRGSATNATFGEPTYRWAYTGTRNDIELRNPDAATCAFTAPDGLSGNTVLVFRLVVEDSRGGSAEDTVSITVTGQKVAFSSKDGGGTITLGDGSTVELTVNRDAGSPPGDPVIILPPDLLEDISEITFDLSPDSPETSPSGFRLEGSVVVDIDLGVGLEESETVTICLPTPAGNGESVLHHYNEGSRMWEPLESRLETVNGVWSVCAETNALSLFGVFVAEQGGGSIGCAITIDGRAGRTPENTAFNLFLVIFALLTISQKHLLATYAGQKTEPLVVERVVRGYLSDSGLSSG